jgi:hypothetical protein
MVGLAEGLLQRRETNSLTERTRKTKADVGRLRGKGRRPKNTFCYFPGANQATGRTGYAFCVSQYDTMNGITAKVGGIDD